MKRELFETVVKLGVMAAVMIAACPDMAWAADLGASVTNVKASISLMPQVVSGFAYAAGGAAILSGAGMLKKHADNPQQNPLAPGVTRMAIGGVVAATPAMLSFVNATLKNDGGVQAYQPLGTVDLQPLFQTITSMFS